MPFYRFRIKFQASLLKRHLLLLHTQFKGVNALPTGGKVCLSLRYCENLMPTGSRVLYFSSANPALHEVTAASNQEEPKELQDFFFNLFKFKILNPQPSYKNSTCAFEGAWIALSHAESIYI